MADEDEPAPLRHIALALVVHLGDQRAGRIKYRQMARGCFFLHAFGDAMRAENRDRVRRHFGKVFDEARAFGLQTFHDMLVVHDLVTHVDRRPILLQGPLDDLDGADDAGAESARLSKYDLHQ